MVYNGTTYYYVLNQQGDVIRVLGADGTTYASYTYDAWGRLVYAAGSLQSINPLRYRGYYYDNDIKMYYLGSRFYDPALKRFISADSANLVLSNINSLHDKNLYAYCDNNPVMRRDDGGEAWSEIFTGIAVVAGITAVVALGVATAGVSIGAMAIVGGGTVLTASITSAGTTAFTVASAATVVSSGAAYYAKKTKDKGAYDPDPYGRAGQKKQGRENKNKNRKKPNFKPRNNRRDNMPAKPKHHTPGREHQQYPQKAKEKCV